MGPVPSPRPTPLSAAGWPTRRPRPPARRRAPRSRPPQRLGVPDQPAIPADVPAARPADDPSDERNRPPVPAARAARPGRGTALTVTQQRRDPVRDPALGRMIADPLAHRHGPTLRPKRRSWRPSNEVVDDRTRCGQSTRLADCRGGITGAARPLAGRALFAEPDPGRRRGRARRGLPAQPADGRRPLGPAGPGRLRARPPDHPDRPALVRRHADVRVLALGAGADGRDPGARRRRHRRGHLDLADHPVDSARGRRPSGARRHRGRDLPGQQPGRGPGRVRRRPDLRARGPRPAHQRLPLAPTGRRQSPRSSPAPPIRSPRCCSGSARSSRCCGDDSRTRPCC